MPLPYASCVPSDKSKGTACVWLQVPYVILGIYNSDCHEMLPPGPRQNYYKSGFVCGAVHLPQWHGPWANTGGFCADDLPVVLAITFAFMLLEVCACHLIVQIMLPAFGVIPNLHINHMGGG